MLILVHGGAALVPIKFVEKKIVGLKNAVRAGYHVLKKGGSALDAVEAAVNVMEDDPGFNAGYGSSLTNKGEVEMDAIVIDGINLKSGAVAGVSRIKNPVSLARKVMEKTDHCLLIGDGAEQFAQEVGEQLIDPRSLYHQWAKDRLDEYKNFVTTVESDKPNKEKASSGEQSDHDTVGAVAVDANGNVACATSTGGITAKRHGRVGDTPIIGAGGWADNKTCAVSTTGHGESIMRVCLSHEVVHQLSTGKTIQEATDAALDVMRDRIDGYGGIIAVTPDGQIGIGFSTLMMGWAYIKSDEEVIHYGVNHGEDFISAD